MDIWKEYNIGLSKKNKINLNDLAKNIINSSSIDNYISRIGKKNKFLLNETYYIKETYAIELLNKSKSPSFICFN